MEPYGFTYRKTGGSCRIFVREVNVKRVYDPSNPVVKQYVSIQEHRFDKSLRVWLSTDAYEHEMGDELNEVKLYNEGKLIPLLGYEDEESYREVLACLCDAIIKYGLDHLAEMSVEDEIIPTKAMADKLFAQHKELDRQFVEEYHLKTVPETDEDIDEWYEKIREIIMNASNHSYEEVKELLIRISAFIGERACELLSEKWIFNEDMKEPVAYNENYSNPTIKPLTKIVRGWKYNCQGESWEIINYDREKLKKGLKA